MSFCRGLKPLVVFLAAGAASFVSGGVPAWGAARLFDESTSATADGSFGEGLSLVWKAPRGDSTRAVVEVVGADPAVLAALTHDLVTPDRWRSFLCVRVVRPGESGTPDVPSLWGSYRVTGNVIRFEPRFALEPGLTYQARLDPVGMHGVARALDSSRRVAISEPRSAAKLISLYSPPKKPARSTTQVAHIYPTRDLVPENLLRFYICFSSSMSRGEAYSRITLLDEKSGKPVDAPFLELEQELWSPDGTRFTLLLDPGRIKRGLKPREEVGPVLEAGKAYSLVINREWLDASGNPLKEGFRKAFRVGPPDDTSPDPKTWAVHSPPPGGLAALVVRFPEPLDRALLDRLIWVEDRRGMIVPGRILIDQAETNWRFEPARAWTSNEYRLVVETELEDMAGNSVARPFEVDIAGPISVRSATKRMTLPFRVGPAAR